jgi:hypothetical protein
MTNQIHLYEPRTSQNAALVLVDHQVGLMTGVRDYSTGELKSRGCNPVQSQPRLRCCSHGRIDHVLELAGERFQGEIQ